jgi:hypothetical protein
MANVSNLIIPGEQINPKTGTRQFDFDQQKQWMVNVIDTIAATNSSANGSSANVTAAYNQANAAYRQANTALVVAEEAYATANEALNQNSSAAAVYINGNLLLPNANVDFVNGNTTEMNGYTADGLQSTVFVEVNPNLSITSLQTSGNINVGQTIFVAGNTDLYGAVNTALLVAEEAYTQANSADATAITALAQAVQANNLATQANNTANAAYSFANTLVQSITVANTSNLVISGNATNVVIDTVLTGGGGGGGGGNYQVDVYANGTIALPNAALDFNNTATVNVSVTPANSNTIANVAFNANVSAIVGPTAAFANTLVQAITAANTSNLVIGGNTTNVTIDTVQNYTYFISDVFYTANAGDTTFNVTSNVAATRYLFVFRNGVEQLPTIDYTTNGSMFVVLSTACVHNEEIELRNFAVVGNLQVNAGTTQVNEANVFLGAQPFYQTNYTYYTVPGICATGMASRFYITSNTIGLYDVIVSGYPNTNGTTYLSATDINTSANVGYQMSSVWFYATNDGTNNLYIGIKNRGGVPMSFNLALLTMTKYS